MIARARPKKLSVPDRTMDAGMPADERAYLKSGYASSIPRGAGIDPTLDRVLDYVLAGDGSFVRAWLGYLAMLGVGATREDARRFGVAVEYFHTASLLFDDLPAMDDGTYRRGRLCPHLEFSEADAMLAGLALITHAYDLMFQVMAHHPVGRADAARKVLAGCLGTRGILSGQSADLHYAGVHAAGDDVLAIATGKTGTLLRLLLLFPTTLFGASMAIRRQLGELASSWGIGYQVLDDFKDCLQSELESGKSAGRDGLLNHPNYVIKMGHGPAWIRMTSELAHSRERIRELAAMDRVWQGLSSIQTLLESQADRLGRAITC